YPRRKRSVGTRSHLPATAMTPPAIPMLVLLLLNRKGIERFRGTPGSDQEFAFQMLCAFAEPRIFKRLARTPEEIKELKADFEKALSMIRKAVDRNDAEFFRKWARGCEALAAIDPDWTLDPDNFLLVANHFCTVGGRKTNQTEVIGVAINFMAAAI